MVLVLGRFNFEELGSPVIFLSFL
ncbi:uncharacterized protein G2W53_001396 [Senna tora]|uniref:Uncharacterized protein n=1 Tax=Senna tora TaxID=362788 RepID=A0A834XIN1_9FABA|nr:uncharacterized protein G2W53_001396 [Senna tora]